MMHIKTARGHRRELFVNTLPIASKEQVAIQNYSVNDLSGIIA
jgi:hypothetical protein